MVLFDVFRDNAFYDIASFIRWELDKKCQFSNLIPA